MSLKPRPIDPAKVEQLRKRREKPVETSALVPINAPIIPEKSEYERKLGDYQVSLLFSILLTAPQSSEFVQLAENSLNMARQRQDVLYEAIFEGVLAANRNPPDLSEAVRHYHRAFDIEDASNEPPDGFLHSLAWSLFAGSSSNTEVSQLLDRARAEIDEKHDSGKNNKKILQETMLNFRGLPSFPPAFEAYRSAEEDRIRRFHRHLMRPTRLLQKTPLLFFPKTIGKDTVFRFVAGKPVFGNYFLLSGGQGTVIDPDLSFLDEFYRLGGSLRDVRNIVFTSLSEWSGDGILRQFIDVFEKFYREVNCEKLRFFVAPEIIRRFQTVIDEPAKRAITESVIELSNDSNRTFSGDNLLFIEKRGLQFNIRTYRGDWSTVRFTAPLSEVEPEVSMSDCDVSVFAVQTPDDLYRIAEQTRRNRCRLTLLDFPRQNQFDEFVKPLREFLGPDIPFAPADRSLVCDLQEHRFLDAVKSYEATKETGWTDYRNIAWSAESGDLFYFDMENSDRFAGEKDEIFDTFRYNQRRRRGLYFTP